MKKLIRSILFLVVAAAILLISDLNNRKGKREESEIQQVAIFKFNSNLILGETEKGILSELTKSELYKKGLVEITRYCPQGDMPTANTTAMEIVNKRYDLVISISTPGLQVMANANKAGTVTHVFCAVTDPFVSGVGVDGPGKDEHPPYMAGIGTFQPVEKAFMTIREMNPRIKKIGVVWCTSETCSEACVRKARIICDELGIELVEAGIETASQVAEAAMSLAARGVEALWLGGDNTVESALDMYVHVGLEAGIPLFTNNPDNAFRQATFGIGANYSQVGQIAGQMSNEILNGKPSNEFETNNIVPELLYINVGMLDKFKDRWVITDDLRTRVDSLIW